MLPIKLKYLFFLSLISFHIAYSQEGYIPYSTCSGCRTAGTPTAPNPSAADYDSYNLPNGLGQYGNTPVDLYTGAPGINIPIYTVTCRDYALPISLNYDASGIRVDQQASWVGLGWNLSAGSPLTRTMRGGDDFIASANASDNPLQYVSGVSTVNMGNGWTQLGPGTPPCGVNCVSNTTGGIVDGMMNNEKDLQTDIFTVNAGGRLIKFILDPSRAQTRQVYVLNNDKVRIPRCSKSSEGRT